MYQKSNAKSKAPSKNVKRRKEIVVLLPILGTKWRRRRRKRDKKRMIAGVEPGLSLIRSCYDRLSSSHPSSFLCGPPTPRHLPMFFLRVLLEQSYLKVDALCQTQRSQNVPTASRWHRKVLECLIRYSGVRGPRPSTKKTYHRKVLELSSPSWPKKKPE